MFNLEYHKIRPKQYFRGKAILSKIKKKMSQAQSRHPQMGPTVACTIDIFIQDYVVGLIMKLERKKA